MIVNNVRKIRELKGFSQEYLANQLGISQKTYSKIETGQTKAGIYRLEKISKILEIDLTTLLSFDERLIFSTYKDKTISTREHDNFEEKCKIYLEHIARLEHENTSLKKQLDKLTE